MKMKVGGEDCLPCPFCGGKKVDLDEGAVAGVVSIECRKKSCGALGPARKTEQGAVKAWNKALRPGLVPV